MTWNKIVCVHQVDFDEFLIFIVIYNKESVWMHTENYTWVEISVQTDTEV